jgi:hypothetical protein
MCGLKTPIHIVRVRKVLHKKESAIADLVGWIESVKPNKNSLSKISAIALFYLKY